MNGATTTVTRRISMPHVIVGALLLGLGIGLRAFVGPAPEARTLRWRPVEGCAAWQVTATETFEDPRFGPLFNRAPERSSALLMLETNRLVLDGDPGVRRADGHAPAPVHVVRHGPQPSAGATELACRDRSWDPAEDALALGWPLLPTRPIRPGDRWTGAPVHGDGSTCSARDTCCALAECDGGACLLPPWTEHLVDWSADEARIASRWDGGRAGSAKREVTMDRRRALPLSARMEVRLPASGVVRTLTMEPVACPKQSGVGSANGTASAGPA